MRTQLVLDVLSHTNKQFAESQFTKRPMAVSVVGLTK